MGRALGVVVVVVLLTGCTEEQNGPPDVAASTKPTISPSVDDPGSTKGGTVCRGLGRPRSGGEITFLGSGGLVGVRADGSGIRCLVNLRRNKIPISSISRFQWNPDGDRVLAGNRAVSTDLTTTDQLSGWPFQLLRWSRPEGESVIYVTRQGRLKKRSSYGGQPQDISFLQRHDAAVYHPAGTHIATSGRDENDNYGLYLATNLGKKPRLLVRGERARYLTDIQFSEDGRFLFYQAKHGPTNWHLHRLTMGKDATLETLDTGKRGFSYAVSPFYPEVIAWLKRGACWNGVPGTLEITGFGRDRIRVPPRLQKTDLLPLGWLPKSELIVASRPPSCSTAATRRIYSLSENSRPTLLSREDLGSAAVRLNLPPPPPPPGKEQDVAA